MSLMEYQTAFPDIFDGAVSPTVPKSGFALVKDQEDAGAEKEDTQVNKVKFGPSCSDDLCANKNAY